MTLEKDIKLKLKKNYHKVTVEADRGMNAMLKLDLSGIKFPEVQKVQVENQTVIPDVKFPDIQKVEITNVSEPIKIPEVKFPEVQKVELTNQSEVKFPDIQRVSVENQTEVRFPDVQKVEIKNQIPVNVGNKPGKADPTKYIPVRLTDGERFYRALEDAYVAASKGQPGNILLGYIITGQKKLNTTGVAVNLPDKPLKNGVIITAKSDNTGSLIIGMSDVGIAQDGTGNGYILEPGNSVSYGVTNTNTIWVNGDSGDVISWSGS